MTDRLAHHATTGDLGIALSELLLREEPFEVFGTDAYGDPQVSAAFVVDDVDVSDPHNPLVYVTNEDGTAARFRVRIISLGGYE